jgi:hypothetical protein
LDNQYIINPLSLHAILNFSFFFTLHFVLEKFHFVSFRFVWFRFVSIGFVSFRFGFFSFRTLQVRRERSYSCAWRIKKTTNPGSWGNHKNWFTIMSWYCFSTPVTNKRVIKWFYSYIMARTSSFSMRWWRGTLCTRPTRLVGFS